MQAYASNTVITSGTWTQTSATAGTTLKTITVSNALDTTSALKVTAYQLAKGSNKDGMRLLIY